MRGNGADEGICGNGVREEEEEEALSLCDLPISEKNQSRTQAPKAIEQQSQEDFNFFSWGDFQSKESEMCAADEVFFQGQILPLRQSVSSDSGFTRLQSESRNTSRCISRSESFDHSSSSGGITSASSRSSSISSHHSSSSNSSTTTNTAQRKPRPRIRNQFQYSHPSPKPQIRTSSINNGNPGNPNRKSALWSLFRVGLVTTPEIVIQDLKIRTNSNKNSTTTAKSFGSRNSTSSTNSVLSNNSKINRDKKKQPFFFNKNGVFFGSCKCSANAVGSVHSRVAVIKRSGSAKEATHAHEEKHHAVKMTEQQQAGKQALSRHRTFEWLNQLSLEAAATEHDQA